MPWIEANGVSLHYHLDGPDEGEPLVLVHELGGTSFSWEPLIPTITEAGFRVLRWDWRGAGLSEKIRGDLSADTMCGDLAALMDAQDFARPVNLVGTALGGGIAVAFAARYPGLVKKLVASSPATGGDNASRDMLLTRADGVEREGMRPFADPSLARSFPEKYRTDAGFFATYRNRWICNDPASFASHNRMLANMNEDENYAKITARTLVLSGVDDPLRTPAAVKEIADRIPGSEYRELETSHFLPITSPNLWTETVLPFIAP